MKHNKLLKGITASALALTVPMSMLAMGGLAVSAASTDENVSEGMKIYFDVDSTGWEHYRTIYCHIWRADGTGNWTSWQTRKEICTKEDNGLYSYDISKTGNVEEIVQSGDQNYYCVIFSADTGVQTYNTIMNGNCLGDTCYVTGNVLENPVDSEKTCIEAAWKNHPECGSQKAITSTGNVIGTALAAGTTDTSLVADYLFTYVSDDGVADTSKTDKVKDIVGILNVKEEDLRYCIKEKLSIAVQEGSITEEAAKEKGSTIDSIIEDAYSFLPYLEPFDINCDGKIDVQDVTELQIIIAGNSDGGLIRGEDINDDGRIDVQDVTALQFYISQNTNA